MIGLLVAAQLVVMAHAPDTTSACAATEMTVAARDASGVIPQIALAKGGGAWQLLKSSAVSRVERDGAGQSSAITEATFLLATSALGRVATPAFVATAGAARAVASAPNIEVHAAPVPSPAVLVRAWLDRGARARASDTLYVGQQMDYVVDVQLNETARQRLRRNPTFFPPEMPGVLAYDLAPPSSVGRTGQHCFETLSYRRALFPLFAGPTVIAPAALTYSLPLSTSFFSREESFELRTDSVRFLAIDAPAANRPADFAGAVGAIAATATVSASSARMGDPVVLTLHLEGDGNVKLWPRPPLAVKWAMVAPGEERVVVDTSMARVHGTKEFDWLLTPREAGSQEITPIEYPYFDPERGEYARVSTGVLSLDIARATLASLDTAPAQRLAIRRTLRDDEPLPVPAHPWFWLLLTAAPLPVALRRFRDSQVKRSSRRSAALRLRALLSARQSPSPRTLRRAFLDAVAERVQSSSVVTRPAEFSRTLRLAGVTSETADEAGALLAQLDAAAFSAASDLPQSAIDRVRVVARAIDAQALRSRMPSAGGVMLLLVALSATVAAANPSSERSALFQLGVSAYDHAAFPAAQRHFAQLAEQSPRSADAWANLGAAAWQRADTAAAVRAWQRALRLDPLDDESRIRLESTQAPALRSPGYVPPVPLNWLAIAALSVWLGAWLLLGLPRRMRPPNSRALAGGALATAVLLLGASLGLRNQLDPRGLAVLRQTGEMTESPGAAASASAGAGETGRINARDGTWVRITIDGTRAGWVPAASVLPLDASALDD